MERASGEIFSSYVTEHILRPLAIEPGELGYVVTDPAHHATGYLEKYSFMNLVKGFLIDRDLVGDYSGRWLEIRGHYLNRPAFGGLVGTARGFGKFLQDQLREWSVLFNDTTRQLLYTQQRTTRGAPVAITLGWHIGDLDGTRFFYKEGGGGGFHCMMRVYPGNGIGTVVMTNATGFDVREQRNRTGGEHAFSHATVADQWRRRPSFVALSFVASVMNVQPPAYDQDQAAIVAWFAENSQRFRIGHFVAGIAFLLFYFPFFAGLCEKLREAEGTPAIWSRVAWAGAIMSPAAGTTSGSFIIGTALLGGGVSPDVAAFGAAGNFYAYVVSGALSGIVMIGAAAVILRTGVFWRWLGRAGALVGLAAIAGSGALAHAESADRIRNRAWRMFHSLRPERRSRSRSRECSLRPIAR